MFRAGLQRGNDLEKVPVAHVRFDRVGRHQDFAFRHANVELGPETKPLRDHSDQAVGQLRGNAVLDFGRKPFRQLLAEIHQGFGAGRGMYRGQDQMTGLRRGEGQLHGFRLAHFANHEHVRVFPQRVEEGLLKRRRVPSHFALPDVGPARSEEIFNRTLNRHDVPRFGQIDLLNQRGERRGLAAAGRTTDQHQAVVRRDQFLQVGMEIKLLEGRLESGQKPNGETRAARGLQNIYPAPHALNGSRKVRRAAVQKILPSRFAENFTGPLGQRFGRNNFAQGSERAAHTQRGRQPCLQMQVAGTLLVCFRDERFQVHLQTIPRKGAEVTPTFPRFVDPVLADRKASFRWKH